MVDKLVTVVTPTVPARAADDLLRAIRSVEDQVLPPQLRDLNIVTDAMGDGPAIMRNYGVEKARTEWVAFLDDDDYLLPNHLSVVLAAAYDNEADVVWPWFAVEGGTDPFPQHRGRQWNPDDPHLFPITALVRRELFLDVGGFTNEGEVPDPNDPDRTVSGEDFRLWLALSAAGARFHHVDQVTWVWRHHGKNTSGLASRARDYYGKKAFLT